MKGWSMYSHIQQLKEDGLCKAQVARKLGIKYKTVTKYWNLTPEEYNQLKEKSLLRNRKVNTIMFTDLFEYDDKFSDSITSVIIELEEIDEDSREITSEKIDRYIHALENNIEI